MWDRRRSSFTPFLALVLLAWAAACSGGEEGPAQPTPQFTVVINPSPTGPCSRDLAESPPDVTVSGADAGDFLADRFSLASGDFNGDGLDDVLVGAPLADGPDNSRTNAGEAYVIFGTEAPPAQIDLAAGSAGLTVIGARGGDNLGFTVASGDVNGDGLDDALVGARFAGPEERPAAGHAYVVFGRVGLEGGVDTAADEQDVTIVGIDTGDFLSIALAAGDVDGDGTDDVLLGAAGGDGPASQRRDSGEVAVVLGSPRLPERIDLSREGAAFTVYGTTAGDTMPNHLAAGDLDDDGRAELIIGAPFVDAPGDREDAGRVYIVPVPEEGGTLDLAAGKRFTEIVGGARKDGLGFQVAAADLTGDGRDEVIAGARDADGPQDGLNNAGEVHVLLGGDDLPRSLDLSQGRPDFYLFGVDAGDSAGFSVAAADVNGDGTPDLLTGAPVADSCDNQRPEGGDAYAVYGRPEFPEEMPLAAVADLTFLGIEAGDAAGFSLAGGDFNGDGRDDVMVGALQADGPENARNDAGEVYIIFGERR